MESPVVVGASPDEPAAQYDVGSGFSRLDQIRNVFRVVREVGIHLDGEVGAQLERLLETGDSGASAPSLGRSGHQMYAFFMGGDGGNRLTRAVRGVVVDD